MDLRIVILLQELLMRIPAGKWIGAFFAQYLFYGYIVCIGTMLVIKRSAIKIGSEIALSGALAFGCIYIIGHWIERARPFRAHTNQVVALIQAPLTEYSFPSGHAAASFAIAMGYSFYFPQHRWWVMLLASCIALGRVMAGVHYPSDVIVGSCIGMVVAIMVHVLYTRV